MESANSYNSSIRDKWNCRLSCTSSNRSDISRIIAEKLDASEIYPRRLNAKEVLITPKDGEFVFPVTDGSAKLSGRDYEVQEPTLTREYTVRRENLSGESHGDGEEFQPEESKDDEGINKDFWAHAEARKEFIYRHHIEQRSSTNVPREDSFHISQDLHY